MQILPPALRILAVALLASAVLAHAAPAQLVSPFGKSRERSSMDPEDLKLMEKAMRDALEKYSVGATSTWESQKTGRAGQAVVTRTYEMRGMRCAELTHQFTKGPGTSYSAPMCKTEDGTWKLAY